MPLQPWRRRDLLTAFVGAPLSSGPPIDWGDRVSAGALDLWKDGLYLPLLAAAEGAAASEPSAWTQELAAIRAMVGDDEGAEAAWARAVGTPPDHVVADPAEFEARDAIDEIVRRARRARFVMLNEAHHDPRCRVFAARLVEALSTQGFDTLAVEALDPTRQADGCDPSSRSGFYTAEPAFAELIRQARSRGMALVAYEARDDQVASALEGGAAIEARDRAQARNLLALSLGARPDARVIVYCGPEHIAERAATGVRWMATDLRAATGEDPLTIDQAEGLRFGLPRRDARLVATLHRRGPLNASAVLTTRSGEPFTAGRLRGRVDLTVFHPRLARVRGRPGWLASDTGRTHVHVSTRKEVGLVQAVPEADVGKCPLAVPADQVLVRAPTQSCTLFLRPGAYQIRLERNRTHASLGRVVVPPRRA